MIRVVENQDKAAWFTFDKHLPITEFNEKDAGKGTFVLKKKRSSGCSGTIFSGIIRRFARCCLLMPNIAIGDMGN